MHQQTNIGMTAQVLHKLNIFTCVLKLKKDPYRRLIWGILKAVNLKS